MATQTVEFRAATGLTITAKLFAVGSDTEVASVTATEATNRKGTYSAAYTDVAAGEYQLIALNSGIPVASWWVTLTLATATFGTYGKADTRDINTKALDIQSRIPTTLDNGLMRSSVQSMAANTLTASALASDAVSEIAAAVGSGTGTGARTVTITVNDGTTALQNARVRLTNGAETYTGLTNSSGVVVFNVDDNDWVVSITKAGYSYSGTTLTVNGTETATYSMTLIALTASDADKVTGYWTVLDEEGNEASGVVVTVKARQASRGSAGALHDAATRTATSAANGLVQFTNMIPGWRYSVVANDEYVADFTVPADAVTSVELGSIVARLT